MTEDAVPITASTSAPAPQNETKEGGRRRRGRRGRGGDRSDRPAQADAGGHDAANAPSVADVVEIVAGVEPAITAPMREPKPPKPPREPRPPRESREPRESRPPRTAPAVEGDVHVAPSDAPAAQPAAEQPIAAAIESTTVPMAAPTEPVHIIERPPVPELPPIALTLPADSDLVLVETSHHVSAPLEETPTPRPKRVRPPRVEIGSEPLEIVETRKEP